MSTQRFEGPDIAALLTQVQENYGSGAQVVAANRCRTGGVGGFFARESFEIFVEISSESATGADHAETGQRRRKGRSRSAEQAATTALPPALAAPPATMLSTMPASIPMTPTAPPASTPSVPAPLSALEQLIAAADRADTHNTHNTHNTRNGHGGHNTHNTHNTHTSHNTRNGHGGHNGGNSDHAFAGVDLTRAQTPPIGRAPPSFASTMDVAMANETPERATKRRGIFRRQSMNIEPTSRLINLAAIESVQPVPAAHPGMSVATSHSSFNVPLGAVSTEELRALGIPESWLSRQNAGYASLNEVLANIAPPPPLTAIPGTLLAFIGEAASAMSISRAVARALKQDPDQCVLLSPRTNAVDTPCDHVTVIDDLVFLRQRWTGLDRVTVVAIDTGFRRQDIAWSRHAVSVLHPTMRWGVVDATRKGEDVRAWARGLGGLHALAVTGISATTSPASIFNAGVPIARIDGQLATPSMWMKLLDQRLEEAKHRRMPDLISA